MLLECQRTINRLFVSSAITMKPMSFHCDEKATWRQGSLKRVHSLKPTILIACRLDTASNDGYQHNQY